MPLHDAGDRLAPIGEELLHVVGDVDLGNCLKISRHIRSTVLRLRCDNLPDEESELGNLELEVEDKAANTLILFSGHLRG